MAGEVNFTGVVSFVDKRRKATGGYGATPRLPATIEDTFEAVAISQDLAVLAPGVFLTHPPTADSELHNYLHETLQRSWPGLRTTCQLIQVCHFLGIPVDEERRRKYLARQRTGNDVLPSSFYTTLIDREPTPGYPGQGGGKPTLPEQPTVADIRMYLVLLQLNGGAKPADHGELLAWLRRCQNGDGGFGFFPGTTSFIENCHHCLAALNILGAKPDDPVSARQFVLSCQTGGGGFGRSLRAAPFLDATRHALACLRLLA